MRLFFFCLVFFMFITISLFAQPGGGGPGGGGDPDIPITGIEFLLLAGGVLGARRMLKRK